jgi:SAM-dependent methyltransferase
MTTSGLREPGSGQDGGYALALGEVEIGRYRMMAEQARATEADLWRTAGIVPGARVADVGCGPGALLPALAAEVGPTGRVTGVDGDPAAVAAARAYTADSDRVTVVEGRADATGLPSGWFDVVMVRHVLAHNGGREEAIVAHLGTLLRPGGCLYLVDVDGTAMRMMPDDDADLADLHERYLRFHAGRGNDLRAGLRLAGWLRGAGLDVVEYRGSYAIMPLPPGIRPPSWAARAAMVDAGVATEQDLARWGAALDRLDSAQARPTVFAPSFVAIGRRAS